MVRLPVGELTIGKLTIGCDVTKLNISLASSLWYELLKCNYRVRFASNVEFRGAFSG